MRIGGVLLTRLVAIEAMRLRLGEARAIIAEVEDGLTELAETSANEAARDAARAAVLLETLAPGAQAAEDARIEVAGAIDLATLEAISLAKRRPPK